MFGPPVILPVSVPGRRPKWSVMIPTFNGARYLQQTLESVLTQDKGAKNMQIEVVDEPRTIRKLSLRRLARGDFVLSESREPRSNLKFQHLG